MSQKNSQNFLEGTPISLSPSKFELNHRSRFALFSPYTKIKDGEHEKARAASQPLVSIHENASPQKSKHKELPKLLGKLPQIFLYSEKEEANSLLSINKPSENLETIQEKQKLVEPTRNKPKLKPHRGLPPIYSKQKLQDIQKQYSRSQHQENAEHKKSTDRSSQLKFRKFDLNENKSVNVTLETSMNHSFVHSHQKDQSPLKRDFKRQRSSTEHSDRISTQPSNKIQSDSFNESFLDIPEKTSKNKLQLLKKKSEEKFSAKGSSGLLTVTNKPVKMNETEGNNDFTRYRSKSSSRYDTEPAELLIPQEKSMIQQRPPTPKKASSPEKLKISKSESMPKNQEKPLPPVEKVRKRDLQEGYSHFLKPKKEEKLTDDQRYERLIQNKIEDQFSHLFKHFRNKKSRNKKVQFITES